jgi:hypothetical protein
MGKNDCFPSDSLGEGAGCPLIPLDTRPCLDGYQCGVLGGTVCRKLCAKNGDCGGMEWCKPEDLAGLPANYGFCECIDEDGDGACDEPAEPADASTPQCEPGDDACAPGEDGDLGDDGHGAGDGCTAAAGPAGASPLPALLVLLLLTASLRRCRRGATP